MKLTMKSIDLMKLNQKSKIEQMQDFYNWLLKIKNVHLKDNNQIMNACERVTQSQKSFICVSKQINFL